jgi:NAD+ synthase
MIMASKEFFENALKIDAPEVCAKIKRVLRDQVGRQFKKKGIVVAVSGGIDSSVTVALSAMALGRERVLALLMPEHESSDESLSLGSLLAGHLGIETVVEDIGPLLEAAGCYRRRDAAIRTQVPEFGPGYRCKIVLTNVLERDGFNFFHLVVESDKGIQTKIRLNAQTYLEIVAATNMKQRSRKFFEYYHADRLNYAVAGTPNRLEYDLGFFVKNGDGAADLKPIAHLYKCQVYQLAAHLNIPAEIQQRPPTTDTYSLPQSQEEFYFSLPYEQMDMCLYARDHGLAPAEVAPAIGLTPKQVERVYQDIDRKRSVAHYLHAAPLLIEEISPK